MRKTTRLRQLIEREEILVMPGAYDALSAKIIESLGFEAIQATGFGIAAGLFGKPDVGIVSMGDMLSVTRNIIQAVDIPVMADGDTGFGNAINVYHTVQFFEQAGAAGINLEDQEFPKRCGHMDGKQVITLAEMVKKIEAAAAARKDPDFIINARTDAVAVFGVEEAVRRGNAYAEAGADLIFVDAPRSVEEIEYVIKNMKAHVSINMTEGGKTPIITVHDLQRMGAARVSFPVTAVLSAAKGMMEALSILKQDRSTKDHSEKFMTFKDFTDLVGLPEIRELEKQFLAEEVLKEKYHGTNVG